MFQVHADLHAPSRAGLVISAFETHVEFALRLTLGRPFSPFTALAAFKGHMTSPSSNQE